MTAVKGLAIIALLVGGTSLAMAQGQPTGAYPPVAGGAGGNPITNPVSPGPPGPGVIPGGPAPQAAAPARHATPRHLYMTNRTHKGSKMNH